MCDTKHKTVDNECFSFGQTMTIENWHTYRTDGQTNRIESIAMAKIVKAITNANDIVSFKPTATN